MEISDVRSELFQKLRRPVYKVITASNALGVGVIWCFHGSPKEEGSGQRQLKPGVDHYTFCLHGPTA